MPQVSKKKRKKKVDVATTGARTAGGMGKPESAAQKLLRTGSPRQKFEAARVLIKSKTKKGRRPKKRKK